MPKICCGEARGNLSPREAWRRVQGLFNRVCPAGVQVVVVEYDPNTPQSPSEFWGIFGDESIQRGIATNSSSQRVGPTPRVVRREVPRGPVIAYHGTSKEAAQEIQRNGFIPSDGSLNNVYYGSGVYVSREISVAKRYAEQNSSGVIITVGFDVVGEVAFVKDKSVSKSASGRKAWQRDPNAVIGYLSVEESFRGRDEIIIRDPSIITVLGVESL